jgi:hypothetical protein
MDARFANRPPGGAPAKRGPGVVESLIPPARGQRDLLPAEPGVHGPGRPPNHEEGTAGRPLRSVDAGPGPADSPGAVYTLRFTSGCLP